MWLDLCILGSSGAACCRQIIRPIYSRRYYMYTLLPMEESRDGEVPKMIFFVHNILDTIDLRDDIVHWFRAQFYC
jgi:hypothetical protein